MSDPCLSPPCDAGVSKLFCKRPESKYVSFVDGTVFAQLLNSGSMKAFLDNKQTNGHGYIPRDLYKSKWWAGFGPWVTACWPLA